MLTAAEVAKIADLESREVLLAKLAGALKALPTRAAGLFQAPLSQMARLAKALEEKKPAADAPSTDEPMIGNMKKADAPAEDSSRSTSRSSRSCRGTGRSVAEAPAETPAEPAE